jgi:hypothetical protein
MESGQGNILVGSLVTCQKVAMRVFRKEVTLARLELSVIELSQRVSSLLVRSIDITSIHPGCNDIQIGSHLVITVENRPAERKLLSSGTFRVHKLITHRDLDGDMLVSIFRAQGYVMIDKLSPDW